MKYFLVLAGVLILSGCTLNQSSEDTPSASNKNENVSNQQTEETANISEETESPLPEYTLEEVAKHGDRSDCWTVIDGAVADVTPFFGKHPGGDDHLAEACGKDATESFASIKAHDPNGYKKLIDFTIGTLATEE